MKRSLIWLTWLFVVLILVVLVKTIRFSSKQIQVDPIDLQPLDDKPIQRLAQALQLATISAQLNADSSGFYRFNQFLDQNYPLVDSILEQKSFGDFSRLYTWPGRNPGLQPIMLIAHLDVVEVADSQAWTHPPFAGTISDGFIWGRGALDDKASVLGILEAVQGLLEKGYQPERTLYLGFGHDEEIGGSGAKAIAQYLKDQGVNLAYVLDEGYFIVEEALPGLRSPLALIGIAEKGYLSLELEVQLKEGGHSSMPPQQTAIGMLSAALHRLEQEPFPARINGPLQQMFEYAGPEMAPLYKVIFANLWLSQKLITRQLSAAPSSNALLRTTTAPTVIKGGSQENVLPTQARATVNFRIIPGETTQSVLDRVRRLVESEVLSVRIKPGSINKDPSAVASTESFGFQVVARTIREVFPEVVVAPNVTIGATDARHYAEVSEHLYRFLPFRLAASDLGRIHGSDERLALENYQQGIRWYEQLIKNSCR